MIEQRKDARTHLIYYLRVFDRADDSLFGHVVDVSSTGMLITCDRELSKNHQYQLAVEDTTLMDRLDVIHFNAECKWCSDDENNLLVDGGFELINPSEPIAEMIAEYH